MMSDCTKRQHILTLLLLRTRSKNQRTRRSQWQSKARWLRLCYLDRRCTVCPGQSGVSRLWWQDCGYVLHLSILPPLSTPCISHHILHGCHSYAPLILYSRLTLHPSPSRASVSLLTLRPRPIFNPFDILTSYH